MVEMLTRSPLPGYVARHLVASGIDPAPFLARRGLPPDTADRPYVIATIDALDRFYADVATETNRPNLGLDMSALVPRGAYGLVEFSIRSAPTIRAALHRMARYAGLLNEITQWRVHEGDQETLCEMSVPDRPLALGRHSNEYFLAYLIRQGRGMTSGTLVPKRVWFVHPPPADLRGHIELFGTAAISFHRETNGFALPSSQLDAAVTTADVALMSAIDEYAGELLRSRPAKPDLLLGVRLAIRESMAHGQFTLEAVAERLGTRPRTLQRWLGERNTSFREVLENVRSELAEIYEQRGIPRDEIAVRLGYSELGPWRRALRRRAQRRGEPSSE